MQVFHEPVNEQHLYECVSMVRSVERVTCVTSTLHSASSACAALCKCIHKLAYECVRVCAAIETNHWAQGR